MVNIPKDTAPTEVDLGAAVLKEANKTGEPVFHYVPNSEERIVARERTKEEKEFIARSCYDTAR